MSNKRTEINKRWQEKNKEHTKYLQARSMARGFINNKSTLADLQELKALIQARETLLLGLESETK